MIYFCVSRSLLFGENSDVLAACYSTFALMQKWNKKSRLHKKA
jgi:hypothetical protein